MKRILLIGFDPVRVDDSDPTPPPGMTAEKIHAGVKLALAGVGVRDGLSWGSGKRVIENGLPLGPEDLPPKPMPLGDAQPEVIHSDV